MNTVSESSRPSGRARFLIRPMTTPAERAGRAFVHYTAWQETYAGLMPESVLSAHTLERCRERAERYPDNTLVALDTENGNQVVGFACCCPEARPFVSVPEASEISALYVLRDFQGLGVGRMLLERCLTLLPYPRTALFVLEGNERAIGFYAHLGFRMTGHVVMDQRENGTLAEREMILER